jgi:2-amino-4-hydroxy-6-hydroxymethyldihydropteridine diphosphokinase
MNIVFLGLGTNLGDKELNLEKAVAGIEEFIGKVIRTSSIYETEPWGFITDEKFLNLVVKAETELKPLQLLDEIHKIESASGRVRGEVQYSPRVIDIDILLYENMIIAEDNLKVPHPLMKDRKFVLIPLCEIEPGMVHPVLGKTFTELLEECEDRSEVKKYAE